MAASEWNSSAVVSSFRLCKSTTWHVEYQPQIGCNNTNKSPLTITWCIVPVKRKKLWTFCCLLSKLNTSYFLRMSKFRDLRLNQKHCFEFLLFFNFSGFWNVLARTCTWQYFGVVKIWQLTRFVGICTKFSKFCPVKRLSQVKLQNTVE